MTTHDTSNHTKMVGPSMTTGQKNNGGIDNAGSTMPPAHHSIRHGSKESKYMPDLMDHDGEDFCQDPHPDMHSMDHKQRI